MIELIGVLSVLLILAVAVTPTLLTQLAQQARQREADTLSAIGGGLRESILASRQVPAAAAAPTNVAAILGWPVNTVLTNPAGNARVFFFDPALRLGATTAASLPYTQGTNGASNIVNAQMLLVSGLGAPLPAVIGRQGTNATAVFTALWNAEDATTPPGWSWGGNWSDILIQRLDLRPLFTRVVLNNNTAQIGRFSIDNTNVHVALPSNPYASYYLARTGLGLHSDTGPLQVMQIVPELNWSTNNPAYGWFPSYVYEQGIWRGRLFMGLPPPRRSGQDLQAAYEIFMSGPPNVYHVGGVNQSSVTWGMYLFMSNYVVWASSGFTASRRAAVVTSQTDLASQLITYCNKKAQAP